MASAGSLTVDLTLQCAQFISNATKAAQATQKAALQISSSFDLIKKGGELLAGAFALDVIIETGKRALEFASRLDEVSQQLGVTATDLQTFNYAGSQVGITNEEMEKALGKFTKTLGSARAGVQSSIGVFNQLGISTKDIMTDSTHDLLLKAADGIGKIGDGASRATPEIALFGKTGQKLDTLLSGGAKGVTDLTDAAKRLGLVLTHDEIENADKAADKLVELKQVLEANIARVVADNAEAIYEFAEALEKLTLKGVDFVKDAKSNFTALAGIFDPMVDGGLSAFDKLSFRITSFHDQLVSILGGIDTLRNAPLDLIGGVDGKVKSLTGYNLPNAITGTAGVQRSDLAGKFDAAYSKNRLKEFLNENPVNPNADNGSGASGARYNDPKALAAAQKERERLAKEAARKAAEAARAQSHFDSELGHSQNEVLGLQSDLTADLDVRNDNARQQIEQERITKNQTIQLDDKLTSAQKAQLTALNDQAAKLQLRKINYQDELQIDRETVQAATDRLTAANDILGSQRDLARTAAERQKIELQLLANAKAEEQARLKPILDDEARSPNNRHYSQAEIDQAKQQASTIDARYDAKAEAAKKQNLGPLASYLDAIPKDASDINEALQNVAADGLDKLTDGLTKAITGTGTLKDAFKDLASSVISDLAKIAVEQAVVRPLANALFGGIGGGGGGLFGSLLGGLFGKRANGGVSQPGDYLVGERGPELLSIGATANITPNSRIVANDNGYGGLTINFGSITSNDPSAVKLLATQAIVEALPAIKQQAADHTIAKLNRPRI